MPDSASTIALDSRFARELPELAVPWQGAPAPTPSLLVLNAQLATELGIDPERLRSPEGIGLLLGTAVPEGASPVAQVYAGHQFGGYSPILGDGRALLLGELSDGQGGLLDLHLKGAGRTPLSRGGDGLAAVGPMLREYVISEAMHALGIPTTRSLAVLSTGREVRREEPLPGAVLARLARSHLRVGSFQYARATGDLALLRRLADHAIDRHAPAAADAEHPHLALLGSVIGAHAELVARWMLVGFVHGVMNTDNATISGETIDYGPCAFMEGYDPATVFSSIDAQGRYAYGNQPGIAHWNLARFAETVLPLLAEEQEEAVAIATAALDGFPGRYRAAWLAGMRRKLGLSDAIDDRAVAEVADGFVALLASERTDLTSAFRALGSAARGRPDAVRDLFLHRDAYDAWAAGWLALAPDPAAMDAANPAYVPRNHLVEEALAAATEGELDPFARLVEVVTRPFDEREGLERYAAPSPERGFRSYRTFCGT
ncbi:YdiU family protein [Agrococcus sp. 1P02AA]|uniref:protein adenylyltransferase SelO n=1 Tax=Agrococcus sp. 1P02AA TaxID=3132259 RepID=UPI0039A45EA7